MKILVFCGAGASVELGVPDMRAMILGFHFDLVQRRVAASAAARLGELVKDDRFDIESLIEDVDA